MKKTTLLNAPLSGLIASLGHTDTVCLADAGLPVPPGPARIDLAVRPGLPDFKAVLETILEEMEVEEVILAEEIREKNPEIHQVLTQKLRGIPFTYVPHEEFKRLSAGTKAVVRTGECTPYSNVILRSGVVF